MYIMSMNAESAEMTVAKLAGRSFSTEPTLFASYLNWNYCYDYPWIPGCAEVHSPSFWPVEGSRLNLRYMNLLLLEENYY